MTVGLEQRHQTAYRRRPLWLSALVHRLSGVLLAVFLPLHFLALGLAIEGEARLDGFLKWSEQPIVKVAEAGLVVLLVVHLLGGLRLLVVENMPWRDGQKSMAMLALALAVATGVLFLVLVVR
jgi:fumarate reductase subunit D